MQWIVNHGYGRQEGPYPTEKIKTLVCEGSIRGSTRLTPVNEYGEPVGGESKEYPAVMHDWLFRLEGAPEKLPNDEVQLQAFLPCPDCGTFLSRKARHCSHCASTFRSDFERSGDRFGFLEGIAGLFRFLAFILAIAAVFSLGSIVVLLLPGERGSADFLNMGTITAGTIMSFLWFWMMAHLIQLALVVEWNTRSVSLIDFYRDLPAGKLDQLPTVLVEEPVKETSSEASSPKNASPGRSTK